MTLQMKVLIAAVSMILVLSFSWLVYNLYRYGLYFFVSAKFIGIVKSIVEVTLGILISHIIEYMAKSGKLSRHSDTTITRT